jgi:GT2 family glycosyltransferase
VPPDVAVVVLSWNGRDDTLACLRSVRASTGVSVALVVSDNGSADGTDSAVRAAHPDATVIQNGVNLGFAEGVNVGLRAALAQDPAYLLVLNNDARVQPDTIATLVAAATGDERVAAVSPAILFAEPPGLVWFAGADFDPRRGRSGRVRGYRRPATDALPGESFETDRLTGAAMLVRAAALRDVGLFDGELFFLYEDVDWSLRARARGARLLVEPRARVTHRVASSQDGLERTPTTMYYGARNNVAVCRRHAPLRGAAAARRDAAILAVHLKGAVCAHRRGAAARAAWQGWRDGRRGRLGPRGARRRSA